VAPAAPVASNDATDDGQVVYDDDAVIVPAPDASVFLQKPDYAAKKPKAVPFGQSIGARRTFIPILLTGGFIMVALGVLHFVWLADNNPTGGLPVWLVALLFLFGLILWGVAFANMMTVKHLLDAQRRQARA
jgi:hypothetical protein